MNLYFIDQRSSEDKDNSSEIHRDGCPNMPANPRYLGMFETIIEAVAFAARYGRLDAEACAVCLAEENR